MQPCPLSPGQTESLASAPWMTTRTFMLTARSCCITKAGTSPLAFCSIISGSTTANGSVTHSYDADGNETPVNGQTAGYDFENRLVSLGSLASYVYDADGNRVSVSSAGTTTNYVVDTRLSYPSVVEEYNGTTLAARYDYGDDLLRMDRTLPAVSTSYYLYDGLGSTRQLISTNGAVTDSYGYSAFGEMTAHTGNTANPFLFNAQQFD